MTILSLDDLLCVTGGEGGTPDGVAPLNRAGQAKPGHGSLDLFGYSETNRTGIGVEARHRITPNISVFGSGRVGTKDNKPDNGVMGGVRFEW